MNLVDSKKAAHASASGKNKNQKQMKKNLRIYNIVETGFLAELHGVNQPGNMALLTMQFGGKLGSFSKI